MHTTAGFAYFILGTQSPGILVRQECLHFWGEKSLKQNSVYIFILKHYSCYITKEQFWWKTITRINKFMSHTMQLLKQDSSGEISRFLTVVKFGPHSGLENQTRNYKGRKYNALGHLVHLFPGTSSEIQGVLSAHKIFCYIFLSVQWMPDCLMVTWLSCTIHSYAQQTIGHFH